MGIKEQETRLTLQEHDDDDDDDDEKPPAVPRARLERSFHTNHPSIMNYESPTRRYLTVTTNDIYKISKPINEQNRKLPRRAVWQTPMFRGDVSLHLQAVSGVFCIRDGGSSSFKRWYLLAIRRGR